MRKITPLQNKEKSFNDFLKAADINEKTAKEMLKEFDVFGEKYIGKNKSWKNIDRKEFEKMANDFFNGGGLDRIFKRGSGNNNKRRRFNWTDKQLDKLNKVKDILEELKGYKPLTLRQVYYQMVGKGFIDNKVSEYGMLSNLLKWARIDGYIDWEDIEDRVRVYHDLTGWLKANDFIEASQKQFLTGYKRDLLQTQEKYIEIWIEKDALSSIFIKVAEAFTIPVVVCRGFSSISFLNDFKTRLGYKKDKEAIMLYFGDFDPSGMEMLEAMETTLRDELNLSNIEFKRVALLKDDIFKYQLPHNPNALKRTDTRADKHLKKYGELAVELDALRPDILEAKIKTAINNELDSAVFSRELAEYENELDELSNLKKDIELFIKTKIISAEKD